jgi:hypothetical protein
MHSCHAQRLNSFDYAEVLGILISRLGSASQPLKSTPLVGSRAEADPELLRKGMRVFDSFHAATTEAPWHRILGSDKASEGIGSERIPLESDSNK